MSIYSHNNYRVEEVILTKIMIWYLLNVERIWKLEQMNLGSASHFDKHIYFYVSNQMSTSEASTVLAKNEV